MCGVRLCLRSSVAGCDVHGAEDVRGVRRDGGQRTGPQLAGGDLHNAEDVEIRIELRGPLSPMKILPLQGESYLFLVLPVRLKNEG